MQHSKTVSKSLGDNQATMRFRFHAEQNGDIMFRDVHTAHGVPCVLVFIDGMADRNLINEFILQPLLVWDGKRPGPEDILQTNTYQVTEEMDDAVNAVLAGDTALFLDGFSRCYICETKGFEHRAIGTPTNETTIKGSQEAFSESIRVNTSQIHRILKTTRLVTEYIAVGEINRDMCAIQYLDGVVDKNLVAEVRKRLSTIQSDFIMGTGMIEQLIEDSPFSLFPSMLSTERPARAAYYLNSGRVIILVDGNPYAIVVPVTLALLLDSPEGSSQRWINGTFARLIRMVALFCTTMLSGVYLSLVLFHREMLPTTLMGAIMQASSNVPFPVLMEILVMEIFFELVREAGLRIPSTLGGAISIVGALILGQSAVEANLVSPVTLIVVALSGVGNAALPDYDLAFGIRTMKLFMIFMGAYFGFLGIAVALIVVITILSNQNSFGVPMLSMQGLKWSAGTPLLFQLPVWKQQSRPRELHPEKAGQAPHISRPWTRQQQEE